jgi:hypothetical protein
VPEPTRRLRSVPPPGADAGRPPKGDSAKAAAAPQPPGAEPPRPAPPRPAPPRVVKLAPAPRRVARPPADAGGRARLVVSAVAGAVLLAVAAFAAAGWWLGEATRSAPPAPPPPASEFRIGDVGVWVSGEWSAVDGPRGLWDLDAGTARAFAPTAGLSVRTVITVGPATDATMLPAPLRVRLGTPLPRPVRDRVAGARAWTYRAPDADSDRERLIEVTVVPTTVGVLSVGCFAGHASWNAARGCAGGIERLDLGGARVLAPTDGLAFRHRLPAVVERLDDRRIDLRRGLRRSRGPGRQAAAAVRLARVHDAAAATLAPFAPERGAPVALMSALRRTARAYRGLAIATRRGAPVRHRRARREVQSAETRLKRQLRGFDDPSAQA